MAKLLDKKERVYDLKLTGYGKYLLSVGKYKPTYYAFFDDNVIYDGAYANISESQNQVHERVKSETSYIESLVLFEDIHRPQLLTRDPLGLAIDENGQPSQLMMDSAIAAQTALRAGIVEGRPDLRDEIVVDGATMSDHVNYYLSDVVPIQYVPRKDIFKYDLAIGDAVINSKQKDVAPAWKVVVLNGEITSTERTFKLDPNSPSGSEAHVPQVNIRVQYEKQIKSQAHRATDPMINSAEGIVNSTPLFAGDDYIRLQRQDPVIYVDEINTSLLTENFDVEVFMVTSSVGTDGEEHRTLERKYFETLVPQIVDGIMTRPSPDVANVLHSANTPTTAVEYFFDFRKDSQADPEIICKQLQIYNKTSYYIDLDIDCSGQDTRDLYNDIYGSEVEPEICLD